ncbi:aldehyde dehydrogenase domain-containing protein [Aspergillus lucknowensis]|uniref:Aldehyde dehydrogenase domain-containing protein n=1 Tax=Aspergillus lucknowensis TaxID=176173 RepID=A0ABR4LSB1_9EURO
MTTDIRPIPPRWKQTFDAFGALSPPGGHREVQAHVVDDVFVQRLTQAAQGVKLGSGHELASTHGPLISTATAERVSDLEQCCDPSCKGGSWMQSSSRPRYGANSSSPTALSKYRPRVGHCFFKLTIRTHVSDSMGISREGVFGPVARLYRLHDEDQVIAAANNCDAGLASCIFTQDLNRQFVYLNRLKAA